MFRKLGKVCEFDDILKNFFKNRCIFQFYRILKTFQWFLWIFKKISSNLEVFRNLLKDNFEKL